MNGAKIIAALFAAACCLFAGYTRSVAGNQGGPALQQRILSNDYGVAKKALDENRRAGNTKLVCLSLRNSSLMIRKEAAEALKELRDKSSVSCLIESLEQNQVVYTGGTETQILQRELNVTIASALEKLTGLTLLTKPDLADADVRLIIRRSKRWWAAHQRRRTR